MGGIGAGRRCISFFRDLDFLLVGGCLNVGIKAAPDRGRICQNLDGRDRARLNMRVDRPATFSGDESSFRVSVDVSYREVMECNPRRVSHAVKHMRIAKLQRPVDSNNVDGQCAIEGWIDRWSVGSRRFGGCWIGCRSNGHRGFGGWIDCRPIVSAVEYREPNDCDKDDQTDHQTSAEATILLRRFTEQPPTPWTGRSLLADRGAAITACR